MDHQGHDGVYAVSQSDLDPLSWLERELRVDTMEWSKTNQVVGSVRTMCPHEPRLFKNSQFKLRRSPQRLLK